jgi:hypothetical protein
VTTQQPQLIGDVDAQLSQEEKNLLIACVAIAENAENASKPPITTMSVAPPAAVKVTSGNFDSLPLQEVKDDAEKARNSLTPDEQKKLDDILAKLP